MNDRIKYFFHPQKIEADFVFAFIIGRNDGWNTAWRSFVQEKEHATTSIQETINAVTKENGALSEEIVKW
jgi:hypothetical protein